MSPGNRPKVYQKIWAAAYADNKVECFEVRTMDAENKGPYIPYWHKQYPLGQTLADFLNIDFRSWNEHLDIIQFIVDTINAGDDDESQFLSLFNIATHWLRTCSLVAPMAAAVERLSLCYERGETLSADEVKRHMTYYQALQFRLKTVVRTVFDTDNTNSMTSRERYMEAWREDKTTYPELRFGQIQVQEVWINGIMTCLYDNALDYIGQDLMENGPQEFVTREVVVSEEPSDLVDFMLNRYLDSNLEFRTCKYCGRLFGAKRGSKGEYCDRKIAGSTKTCKQAGSLRLYEQRRMEEPAVKAYKKAYKTHNARIRYGLMTRAEFVKWSAKARLLRDQCLDGKLSLEEFQAWLDHDKL
ncbi:MAG: hypothetical protein IJ206_11715 [Oscillospiraceae bacterium]|nr:hypothetical protein [Oscillospiraceae bacterium]